MTRVAASMVIGVFLAACGSKDSPKPPSNEAKAETKRATPQGWMASESAAFAAARTSGKPVLIHFFAKWAVQSTRLDKLLDSPQIASVIDDRFVRLRIDVSDETDEIAAIKERYGATYVPYLVAVTADGKVLGRVTQLEEADELRAKLEAIPR
jgi:thioredoxin:protein disulfide reductase